MDPTLQERADAYLDGSMSREEALAFEGELAQNPEAGEALGAALSMRELLRALPPVQPPEGLEERILAALPLRARSEKPQARSPLATVRAALAGASWGFRGPAALLGETLGGARPVAAGMAEVRWALGPLAPGRSEPRKEPARKPVPIWKRALGLAGA